MCHAKIPIQTTTFIPLPTTTSRSSPHILSLPKPTLPLQHQQRPTPDPRPLPPTSPPLAFTSPPSLSPLEQLPSQHPLPTNNPPPTNPHHDQAAKATYKQSPYTARPLMKSLILLTVAWISWLLARIALLACRSELLSITPKTTTRRTNPEGAAEVFSALFFDRCRSRSDLRQLNHGRA